MLGPGATLPRAHCNEYPPDKRFDEEVSESLRGMVRKSHVLQKSRKLLAQLLKRLKALISEGPKV